MRVIFMGTPDFAVPTLDALVAAGHEVAAAYTQPPRPGGRRGRALVPSPVQLRAEALGIEVRSPTSLRKPEAQEAFAALRADVGVVAAYGLILPQPVLDAPRRGCLNVHGSLLPRWRGAAPIQRAILAGDAETGVGIMQMEAGLDTGPVRLEGRTPIGGKTAGELTAELAAMGARLMVEVLRDLDGYPPAPQPSDGATYAPKVDKAEARLDFGRTAEEVERQVRAFSPLPGAWFQVGGERVKVLACDSLPLPSGADRVNRPPDGLGHAGGMADPMRVAERSEVGRGDVPGADGALNGPSPRPSPRRGEGVVLDDRLTIACGSGAIRPTLVQRAGRGVTSAAELLRGFPIPPGARV